MKFSILLSLVATANSVLAAGPLFLPGTDMFSRKSMSKWRDFLYNDKGFRNEYKEYVSGYQHCPSNIKETNIKLVSAYGEYIKPEARGWGPGSVWDWNQKFAKSPGKLNAIHFKYHIKSGETLCGVATVRTGKDAGILHPTGYYWQKPTLYGEKIGDSFDIIDINKVKLSAKEAMKQGKTQNENLKNGFQSLELRMTGHGPMYVFSGLKGNKYESVYVDA